MTASEAIRAHCRECTCDEVSEIRDCTATPDKCCLWPYRMLGEGFDGARGYQKRSRIKTIRQECILCSGGNTATARTCESIDCKLWPYREGHNPNIRLTDEQKAARKARGEALALSRKGL